MSMEQVHAIMKEAGACFMATTDGQKAAVRPMGGGARVGDELWFATAANTAKVAEIKAQPSVELCYANKQWRHVRISGTAVVSTDGAEKKKLFDMVPVLEKYFSGPEDPVYVVLKIKVERIRLMMVDDMQYTEVKPG